LTWGKTHFISLSKIHQLEGIELEYAFIYYEKPIIYFSFKENIEIGAPEVRELIKQSEKLSGYTPYVTFSDVTTNMNVTYEGRRVSADMNEAPLHKGNAVLVKNGRLMIAANFFSAFNKSPFPFRAFTDKQEAIDWLLDVIYEKTTL
jgi:hypothetical protein